MTHEFVVDSVVTNMETHSSNNISTETTGTVDTFIFIRVIRGEKMSNGDRLDD